MSPRGRLPRNSGLPSNLYEHDGYFSYYDKETGRHLGLGRDRRNAIEQAIEANERFRQPRLIDRLSELGRDWPEWLDLYERQLEERELADATRRTYRSLLKRARATFSGPIGGITTANVADALRALKDEGKARMAQAFRSFLMDCFRCAIAEGWIDRNPAESTRAPVVKVQRARLTLEAYKSTRERAPVWLRNAMDLALVTGQRREDVANARFADVREDHWFLTQRKTGHRLMIPVSLRLVAIGLGLEEVVRRCRSTGVLSPFLVHQTKPRGNSPRGRQLWVDTISRRFSDYLVYDGEKSPPTFHEIRSLAERLYREQGVDTQTLLGHKDPRTTATYHDARGEWVKVSV